MAKIEPASGPRTASVATTEQGVYVAPPHVFCPACRNGIEATTDRIDGYFFGQKVLCTSCSAEVDWWEAVLGSLREGFAGSYVPLAVIGAEMLNVVIEMTPNAEFVLRFSEYGVPDHAQILEVNYTPQELGLFPLEVHSNRPNRTKIPNVIRLYPRPWPPGGTPKPTPVCIGALWVDVSQDHELWRQLVVAFEAFASDRFSGAIVPANVAVEARLFRIVAEILERSGVSRKHVDGFLRNSATYSHQLNVLLPVLLREQPAPTLPDHIRGSLNRLRDLRNELAHSATFSIDPTRDELATVLCAALFGFRYLGLVESALGLRLPRV